MIYSPDHLKFEDLDHPSPSLVSPAGPCDQTVLGPQARAAAAGAVAAPPT